MSCLDNLERIKKIDKEGIADLIDGLPKQCLKAYQEAREIVLPKDLSSIKKIVVVGMGAPILGGEIAYSIIEDQLKIPLVFCRSGQLPKNIDKESLIILASFSGETRETLSCFNEAIEQGMKIFVISGRGELKKLAIKHQLPLFSFTHPGISRTALGFFIMPILVLLEKLNLIRVQNIQMEASLKILDRFSKKFRPEIETEKNVAKYLAYFIFDHTPLVLAPHKFLPVARRWKNEFNENAKSFAFFDELPEVFHNTIEGRLPWRLKDEIAVLILESINEPKIYQKNLYYFEEFLRQEDIRYEVIPALGGNLLVQTLSLITIGDWTSFYLAILNNQDPALNKKIDWLKSRSL